jgi:DNA-directed RNA polymerase specialized sigma24 family protein
VPTQEFFDSLLAWLDEDREQAGQKYERIRLRLIKIFTCRGCGEAEDLADETINRVCSKVNEIEATYQGDPALYFYGVANKLHFEYLRRQHRQPLPPPLDEPEDREAELECLDRCVSELSPASRDMVLRYYAQEKRAKIEDRKKLADELGIAVNALRIRAHRIRSALQQCVSHCLESQLAN